MSELTLGTPANGQLNSILLADDIQPGSSVGYGTAKDIFEYHPLGGKLAEKPIVMALSQERIYTVDGAPGDDVIEQFKRTRRELGLDQQTHRLGVTAKTYGISALVVGVVGKEPNEPLTIEDIRSTGLYINVVDPLNTAGSLVLNQNPLAPDYLKPREVSVSGKQFHRSRSVVLMNEMPVYLGWTDSAFGFSGRSVYQRILYSLKSYIEVMMAADMLAKKCGVVVTETTQQSSVANELASMVLREKRNVVKMAQTGNVITVGSGEKVYSLDLTNLGESLDKALDQIRSTIAAGSGTPAILINEETFSSGLSEGSEDAKYVAEFVDGTRKWFDPVMAYLDRIAMIRAWTPEFYATIQNRYPEYKNKPYEQSVMEWRSQFTAKWPSYLKESASEEQSRHEKKVDSLVKVFDTMIEHLDPENKCRLIDWLQDCINSMPELVPSQMMLDTMSLQEHLEEEAERNRQEGINPDLGDDPNQDDNAGEE